MSVINLIRPVLFAFLFLSISASGCLKKNKEQLYFADTTSTFFSTLYNSDTLSIELRTDFASIYTNKESDDKHYQSAHILARDGEVELLNEEIVVRPRGITRKRICDFPPLMLKVPDDNLEQFGFFETDNIKLLGYCKDNERYRSYVLKEYLNYKLCNLLTENSFRVKLTKIKLVDSGNEYPDMEQLGFVIEPIDELALRIGCDLLPEDVPVTSVQKDHYKSLVVFQYMIGNSDWNFSERHNVKLINCNEAYGPLPIPYDFDYSGFVNAEYAEPHPSLPIANVRERLFQWRGSLDEDFKETFALFFDKKLSFYKLCEEFSFLTELERNELLAYLDLFYENISSNDIMKKEMERARSKS